jgi:acetate CoA/acetoacetate CoA-transferase alpha subunit
MKNKTVTAKQAVSGIKDGAVIMFGGFLGCGTPEVLIDALLEKGVKDITVICNDTATPTTGVGRLVAAKRVRKVIASHIGTNPETGAQMNSGETEVELIPQGTLAERIRCAGYGLGGVLTPTGLGTEAEKGKEIIVSDGKSYLLEKPLKADFAILGASLADKSGNLFFKGTTKNFQPLMATAADTVIVYAEKLVETGEIDPDTVDTPGIFVDYIAVKE